MVRVAAVLLVFALAGCLSASEDGPAREPEDWRLHGWFTAERSQADVDALCAVARDYENECVLMESWPEQFALRFDARDACEAARARIEAIPHTQPDECRIVMLAGAPETPTSTTPRS